MHMQKFLCRAAACVRTAVEMLFIKVQLSCTRLWWQILLVITLRVCENEWMMCKQEQEKDDLEWLCGPLRSLHPNTEELHLSDHLSCTQASTPATSWPPLNPPTTTNALFQPHWRAPLSLFCLICFGHCGQIAVITETLEAGNLKKTKQKPMLQQHTKMLKTHIVKLYPLVYNCLFYRCVKWLQTNISMFPPTVAWSLISQLFQWTQYSSVSIISSETFVLNTPFTMWASVVFQSETN